MVQGVRFWNEARDGRLRDLWSKGKSATEIAAAFGNEVLPLSVRNRAIYLKLRPAVLPPEVRGRGRGPRSGTESKPPIVTKDRRVVWADEAPCPYYDPREKADRCGDLVDRRMRPNGTRPSQYCARHEAKVTPIGKSFAGLQLAGFLTSLRGAK